MNKAFLGIVAWIAIFLGPTQALARGAPPSCDDLDGIVAVDPSTGATVDAAAYCRLANRPIFPVSTDTAKADELQLKAAIKSQRLSVGIGQQMTAMQMTAQTKAVESLSVGQTLHDVGSFVVKFGSSKATASDIATDIRALVAGNATVHQESSPSPVPTASSTAPAIDQRIAATFSDFGCYVAHGGSESPCPSPSATPWAAPQATASPLPNPSPIVIPAHSKPSDAQVQIQPTYSVSTSTGDLTMSLDYSASVILPASLRFAGDSLISVGSLDGTITIPKSGVIKMKATFEPSKTASGLLGETIDIGDLSLTGTDLSTVGTTLSQYRDIQFCAGQRRFPIAFISLAASISCKARYGITIYADTEPTLGYALFGPSIDVSITGDVIADAVFVSGTLSANVHLVSADARLGLMYGFLGDKASTIVIYNPIGTYDASIGQSDFTFTVTTFWGKRYDIPIATVDGSKADPPSPEPWYSASLPSH